MAVTVVAYNNFKEQVMEAQFNLLSDTIKVSLHTSSYTPDKDAHTLYTDLTNELAATGNYTTGGAALASKTVTQDNTNDLGNFDAADLTWTALTPSAAFRYGAIYDDTHASDLLIAYIDFGANQDPGGNNFTIQWNASGILTIS